MTTAFRVVAVLVLLWALVTNVIGLVEPVLMALPERVIADLPEFDLEQRTQLAGLGLLSWLLVVSVAVQVRRPHRNSASMVLAVGVVLLALVAFGVWGTFGEWLREDLVVAAPVVLLALMHPRLQRLGVPRCDPLVLALAVVGAAGWGAYAVVQLGHQVTESGLLVTNEGYAAIAAAALGIAVAGLVGATDWAGWLVPGLLAVVCAAYLGIHGLVFPDPPSALGVIPAVLAVLWALALASALAWRRINHTRESAAAD